VRPDRPTLRVRPVFTLLVLAATLLSGVAAAEGKPSQPAKTAEPAIAPEAVAALERMEDFLGTLTVFSVHADTTTDEVLLAGPKVQYEGSFDVSVKWPNRLRITWSRDGRNTQEIYYDGSTLTVWVKEKNLWASTPAPDRIPDALEFVREKYNVSFPLGDFLLSGARKQLLQHVIAGVSFGPSRVIGVETEHLGFHQMDVDWQIWIANGDKPLPRKYLITTLGDTSQPQHSEVLTWDLAPKLDEAMFTFVPPAGAERMVFAASGAKAATPTAPKGASPKTTTVKPEAAQ